MQKNLEGDNFGELPRLTLAMMNEPLYLDVLSSLQLCQDVLANDGACTARVRREKAKAMPRRRAQLVPAPPKAELLPKSKVKAKEVPARGSVLQELGSASSSSGPGSEVPSLEPWELDTHTHTRMGPTGPRGLPGLRIDEFAFQTSVHLWRTTGDSAGTT